ncbi:PREDICTED: uncharacterized protein LOC108781676 [Cyphomyrmex costatus]|uniref:uncharacterized protein LOC108781676 n=1 Tax=Cyphomyrmex costatus TaxID=456900 RepID=UPI0008522C8C|nr:PREDICTED: uncharacterized protein LOC108781676 [Cyphomyrmex costatus]
MSTEESLAVLKRKRATLKSSCTRIRTYVESVGAVTPAIAAQLQERKDKLDHYWSEYDQIQSNLEALDEKEEADRAGFEEAFYVLSAKIRELLSPPSAVSRDTTASPSTSSVRESFNGVTQTHVRLPKLNLPTFSGSYDEWFPFHDNFMSVIHNNVTLSNIQRFQYLRASLTGEASKVVNSLEITEANYSVAWALLCKRYDNKRVIVENHIRALVDTPSIAKENAKDLRRLADDASRRLHALQALKCPTNHWDDLLVYILKSKLDKVTMREWQTSLTGDERPTLKQFLDFIAHQCQTLEATHGSGSDSVAKGAGVGQQSSGKRQSSNAATVKSGCYYCKGEHSLYSCKDFLALPVARRISEIRARKICLNCLRSNSHVAAKCTSGHCKMCQAKHNSLLHLDSPTAEATDKNVSKTEEVKSINASSILATHSSEYSAGNNVILSTALVYVIDKGGTPMPCRALLDSGSQANFISSKFLATLNINPRHFNVSISGVGGSAATSSRAAQIKLQSRVSSYNAHIDCIVTDSVTERLPSFSLKRADFSFPHNIKLADPRFHVSSEIDLLIGAEIFWDIVCIGQIKASSKHPTLQKTRLGWILAGRTSNAPQATTRVHSLHASVSDTQLHSELKRFWDMDETTVQESSLTMEENSCERRFLDSVQRNQQGRLVVQLPIKKHLIQRIGDSRNIALNRLRTLERRFKREPEVKVAYSQFLDEYLALGHMRLANPSGKEVWPSVYLPHHCVFKITGNSSKIRVVFDASSKGSNGLSLNDTLMVGPVVQQDLASTLTRFRTFQYVVVADIIKMYRQILLDPSQTCLQKILWRNDPADNVEEYELLTLTYGTSSASYLATKCLVYLASQLSRKYPIGAKHVMRDFYMDDMLTGANTIEEARTIRDEVIQLLKEGGFELGKWASNNMELLEGINNQNDQPIDIHGDIESCILGTKWDRHEDAFFFCCKEASANKITKRHIVSDTAKLYDPLGLLGPVIVIAKLIVQELWQSEVQWDESVPLNIHTRWVEFRAQLDSLNHLRIPRFVNFSMDTQSTQIHGFCDASQNAYGACIYVRTRTAPHEYRSELLCSRSRVAPLKAMSLPRLELCAALLLARLIAKVREAIRIDHLKVFLWSDSTIALNWITSPSRRWSTFVANRVGEVQRITEIEHWHHVSSSDNSADILSRGLNPNELINSAQWWHGPSFLQRDDDQWPDSSVVRLQHEIPEQRKIVSTVATVDNCIVSELINRHSSIDKVSRIIAYCLRFFKARRPGTPAISVAPAELSYARSVICRIVQRQSFDKEYMALQGGGTIVSSSKLLPLAPFLDKKGLLRVGGRLSQSNLEYEARHPILLPRGHMLTKLIIEQEHRRTLHSGAQATMASVRQRARPRQSEAVMGSLPAERVTPSKSFSHCGVDYAGPVFIKDGRRRNAQLRKAYVSIFICFATRAVHIELGKALSDVFRQWNRFRRGPKAN